MKFIFDENLPRNIAIGLSSFGEDVDHVLNYFDPGTRDVEILEFVGKNGHCLITKDKRIRYNQSEILAVRKYKVGAFFIVGKSLKMWDLVKLLIRNWDGIKEIAATEKKPFIYKLRARGKPVRYNL